MDTTLTTAPVELLHEVLTRTAALVGGETGTDDVAAFQEWYKSTALTAYAQSAGGSSMGNVLAGGAAGGPRDLPALPRRMGREKKPKQLVRANEGEAVDVWTLAEKEAFLADAARQLCSGGTLEFAPLAAAVGSKDAGQCKNLYMRCRGWIYGDKADATATGEVVPVRSQQQWVDYWELHRHQMRGSGAWRLDVERESKRRRRKGTAQAETWRTGPTVLGGDLVDRVVFHTPQPDRGEAAWRILDGQGDWGEAPSPQDGAAPA